MDFADEVQASVTFNQTSTCVIIYDDTATNTGCTASGAPWPCCSGAGAGTCADAVIGVWTFTSVQPSAGTLTVAFPTPDATNAIVRIAAYEWIETIMAQALAGDAILPLLSAAWHRDAMITFVGMQTTPEQGKF
jgi:hypothetical protein